ncbi:MarR family transcriptional regulator [Cellvibrio zantedeschiae]|uniref:MarR family transcriptional regulator n=1 Tax=Cellvibrio zantedeschiae TaxID=1237077 RepID=A0ABQ3B3H1_9GAMM|nr:MarR family transcriptional regulator [Cellvibrio zantedeschiae]GGY78089.1 MarR family transcriptional regulator [Cellvibrio zantedeschiae]
MAQHYDPYNFSPKNSLGYLLKTNHMLMHECADRVFANHDITFVQWLALVKLKDGFAETASDLCRTMSHDNGAITRMLDQMESRGFVVRERSQQDRRVVKLRITDAGRAKLAELTPPFITNLNEALAPFSADEFAELNRLLGKLKTCLEQVLVSEEEEEEL